MSDGAVGRITIDTSLDNAGLKSGLKDLKDAFSGQVKELRDLENELESVNKKYDELMSGNREPEELKRMAAKLKTIQTLIKTIENENQKLISDYEKAVQNVDNLRSSGFKDSQLETQIAEVDRLAEQLRPVWENLDASQKKAAELTADMNAIKLHPETSQEAQELKARMAALGGAIGKTKGEADSLRQEIDATRTEINRINEFNAQPAVRAIRQVAAETERLSAEIEKQRQSYEAAEKMAAQYEKDLESAKNSGDELAQSLAQANLDRALSDVEKANTKTQALTYEASKLREFFGGIVLDPQNADVFAKMIPELETLESKLDSTAQKATDLSSDINSAFDFDMGPTEDEVKESNARLDRIGTTATGTAQKVGTIGSATVKGLGTLISYSGRAVQSVGRIGAAAVRGLGKLASYAARGAKHIGAVVAGLIGIRKQSKGAAAGVAKLGIRFGQLLKNAFIFSVIAAGLRKTRELISDLVRANEEMAARLNAIQVNLWTIFAPIWEIVQPALLSFLYTIEHLTAYVAAFFAMLGGKTYEQAKAAAQALYEQIKAFKNTEKAADKAAGALAGFDQINQLGKTSDSASEGGLDFGAVEPPDLSWLDGFIAQIKETAGQIFDVFKAAWDSVGEYFLGGWKHALDSIIDLAKSISATFMDVWTNGHGQAFLEAVISYLGTIGYLIGDIAKAFGTAWDIAGYDLVVSVFEVFTNIFDLLESIAIAFRTAWNDDVGVSIITNILQIFTNINNIISNLSIKLREAWESNANGVRIWSAILGVIDSVLDTINRMTSATVGWIKSVDFEPLVSSFANLVEAIKPVVDIVLGGLEWAYKNVLLPFAGWLIELVVPAALDGIAAGFYALEEILRKIQPELETFAQKLVTMWGDFEALGEPLKQWVDNNLVPFFNQTVNTVGNIFAGLFDTFNMVFSDIWNVVLYPMLEFWASEWLPVITDFSTEAVRTLETLFIEVKTIFDKMWSEGVKPFLELITGMWIDIGESLAAFWNKWGKPIFDNLREAIENVSDILISNWENFIKPVWDKFMKTVDKLWKQHLKPLVDNFLDFVGELVNGALEIYNKFIAPIVKWLNEVLGPVFAFVFGVIIEHVGNVISQFADMFNGIITALKGIVQFIVGVFTGDWDKAWQGIKNIFQGVWDFLIALIVKPFEDGINALRDFQDKLSVGWTGARDAIVSAFKGIWEKVKAPINVMIGGMEKMVNSIINGINGMIDKLNSLRFSVPSWVPIIGGETFSLSIQRLSTISIPRLAQGGLAYSPTLAVVGDNPNASTDPEVIAPLSKLTGMLASELQNFTVDIPGMSGLIEKGRRQSASQSGEAMSVSAIKQAIREALSESGGGGANSPTNVTLELDSQILGRVLVPIMGGENARLGTQISTGRPIPI